MSWDWCCNPVHLCSRDALPLPLAVPWIKFNGSSYSQLMGFVLHRRLLLMQQEHFVRTAYMRCCLSDSLKYAIPKSMLQLILPQKRLIYSLSSKSISSHPLQLHGVNQGPAIIQHPTLHWTAMALNSGATLPSMLTRLQLLMFSCIETCLYMSIKKQIQIFSDISFHVFSCFHYRLYYFIKMRWSLQRIMICSSALQVLDWYMTSSTFNVKCLKDPKLTCILCSLLQ